MVHDADPVVDTHYFAELHDCDWVEEETSKTCY